MCQLASIRKILRHFVAGFFVCTAICSHAQSFNFDESCRKAYNSAIALRLDEARTLLKDCRKTDNKNLIPTFIDSYVDFLWLYTNDTRELYNKLKSAKDLRLEQLKQGDKNSPYFLYTQAEVNLQWAVMDLKFGDYMAAIFEIRKAFKLLEENQLKFPDFKANKKSLGLLYSLLGSVPDKYKWGVSLLGMEGSITKGMKQLSEVVDYGMENDFIFKDESNIIYSFLLFHLQNQPHQAWQVLAENKMPHSNNLMDVYTCAHIGVYGKHNDEALAVLNQKETTADAYLRFPFIEYLKGLALLNRADTNAIQPFRKFITSYKGENHIKSSFQKMAWCYLLNGDTVNYLYYISKVENMGAVLVDADKQAMKEAESGKIPDIHLLRARLLFDGGYYEKAMKELSVLSDVSFKSIELETEYLYRFARVYDEWNKPDSALIYYTRTIEKGRNIPRYFAANSAFESGKIYEQMHDIDKARQYYNLCLTFENHEYKNGIDQKAKAGLNRLK
jgi:hypothetical protein